jgi:hypothetical protein
MRIMKKVILKKQNRLKMKKLQLWIVLSSDRANLLC